MTDTELLRAYAERGSESAFRTLAERYVRLVYQACWRQLRDEHLAEDGTQAVFLLLSQKAPSLARANKADGVLAGWLLTTARYACANLRRTERRRELREAGVAREQVNAMGTREAQLNAAEIAEREQLAALLDDGLSVLSEQDRVALSLRYLQGQPLRQVGQAMGVSEDAARKRVDRGLDRLREHFARQGLVAGVPAIVAMLTWQGTGPAVTGAVQTVLLHGIMGAVQAGFTGPTAGAAVAKGVNAVMLWAKIKTAAGVVAAVGAIGVGTWGLTTVLAKGPHEAGGPEQRMPRDEQAAAPATVPNTMGTTAATPAGTGSAPAAIPVVKLDQSTPKAALKSLSEAIKASDKAGVYQCLAVDANRKPTVIDAALAWNMADYRLMRVNRKAFKGRGPEGRTALVNIDWLVDFVSGLVPDTPDGVAVKGDTALLNVKLAEMVIPQLPPQTPPTVKKVLTAWSKGVVVMVREDGKWKLNIDASMRVETGIKRTDDPNADAAQDIALLQELAATLNTQADMVEAGKYKSVNAVYGDMMATMKALPTKYEGFQDTAGIGVYPVTMQDREK